MGQNEEYTLTATLLPASNSLDEVIVTTTAKNNTEASVLLIQKRAVNLIDGLSAQSIQKTGDSDLASAIKRIPGVSVQDGKFVYVRGLGDRYSKTLLGGLEVPGLDPDKNTLQLDIFPTNLLDNILISKSASADLNSDFTGGIVDVILKDFSVLPEYSFSIRGSYNPDMNLNDNFIGNENEINLQTENQEFIEWKWIIPDELPRTIVDFKKKIKEMCSRPHRGGASLEGDVSIFIF